MLSHQGGFVNMESKNYYVGLDIGTDSVGYAVTGTDTDYKLQKFKGEPMWGVTLFDAAQTAEERRSFRTARRRIDRRQQRVKLLQEIFAPEIAKIDPKFYQRIAESALWREDSHEPYALFNDNGYTDREYHQNYPTIHHLLMDLMQNKNPHDVRLVYLACVWLVAHRGHFLSEISEDNISSVTSLKEKYNQLMDYLSTTVEDESQYVAPWGEVDIAQLEDVIKKRSSITEKGKQLTAVLLGGKKAPKKIDNPGQFPFSVDGIVRMLAGSSVKLKDLFGKAEYEDLGSFDLNKADEEFDKLRGELGDDMMLIDRLKEIFDWGILNNMLRGYQYISEAKVAEYNQHKADLAFLKYFFRKYTSEEAYMSMFREMSKTPNYVSYSGNTKNAIAKEKNFKRSDVKTFSEHVLKTVADIKVEPQDEEKYQDMCRRLGKDVLTFLPKQVNGDNRVIPYQLYYAELMKILENAAGYLPFLKQKDADGYVTLDKIKSVMKFRIPYFVGPLNSKEYGWMKRKAEGKIYPWNFDEKVDLDASEQRFIDRMTNTCSYLPGEDVMPKQSLLYERFEVLNEINNLKIEGHSISVELKQKIYNELFLTRKKVTPKAIKNLLLQNNLAEKEQAETLSGIDETIKSSLSSHFAFRNLLQSGKLKESDVENIIKHRTYIEAKARFARWLDSEYGALSEADRRYISSLKFKDFGRLSHRLLAELEGVHNETGEVGTVIDFMWNTNDNLSEILLSDQYSFKSDIRAITEEYYAAHPKNLADRLDEMYVSNAVKRPIYRTMDIMHDVVKAMGHAPAKIFVEMARGATEDQKGKRTKTRRKQLEELFKKVNNEDARLMQQKLKELGDKADNELQSKSVFLYFTQLGRCMYSGKPIDFAKLKDGTYNIDHIYPRSKVKDDSLLNNMVLVLSTKNSEKGDNLVPKSWRESMLGFWKMLADKGLITAEKFKRLNKAYFTNDELYGFINRQLVETRQSTKVITTLLAEKYPDTEIVYVKAGLVSSFRQDHDMLKSRLANDLHHAKDAYLNIVCGNVYNEHFTKSWFLKHREQYTVNSKVLFGNPVEGKNGLVWDGSRSIGAVKKTVARQRVHVTKYAYINHGGLFDQQPVAFTDGLIPRKQNLPTEKYGGYHSIKIAFFVLVKYSLKGKTDVMVTSIDLMHSNLFMQSKEIVLDYIKQRVEQIVGQTVDQISLPLGCRPIKKNTVFSFDGFRMVLTGSGGATRLILSSITMFTADVDTELYIKHLESFAEKKKKYANYLFDPEHDKITAEQNIKLYDLYIDKLQNSIFAKRPNNPIQILIAGRDTFVAKSVVEQALALVNIHQVFGRESGGCDLKAVDGAKNAAATNTKSSKLSNYVKDYRDIRIIDASPSGLWETESQNLLELL